MGAGTSILLVYRIVGQLHPGPVSRGFRLGELASSGLLALSHGTNDAQKTMGVIALALVAHGDISAATFTSPTGSRLLGDRDLTRTFTGGWRIIKTLGTRIIKMDPAQGFAAQAAGATVILASSAPATPVNHPRDLWRDHGLGAAKHFSAVRWGVAGNIVCAWVLTLPAAAIMGAITYAITTLFGHGAVGPVVITAR